RGRRAGPEAARGAGPAGRTGPPGGRAPEGPAGGRGRRGGRRRALTVFSKINDLRGPGRPPPGGVGSSHATGNDPSLHHERPEPPGRGVPVFDGCSEACFEGCSEGGRHV